MRPQTGRRRMLKRGLHLIWVLVGVYSLTFALLHLVPGDPVDVMLGESASPADRAALTASLGLDQPLWQQYTASARRLIHGDFGQSIHGQAAISSLLAQALPATLMLALSALMVGILVGIPLGVVAAVYAGRWQDVVITVFSLRLASMPAFWLGPLLMLLFAVWLGWLPVSGIQGASSLVLPALTLGLGLSALLTRMTRTSVLEVLHEDYIRTARAKGLSRRQVLCTHALRAALLPLVTIVGLQMGHLLAGAVITETLFSWQGVGRLLVDSIEKRDYPVTQACVLVVAGSYVLVNQLTELVARVCDPRLRGAA